MAIRISPPRDDRVERALANPARYFAEAWRRARAEVVEDIAHETSPMPDRQDGVRPQPRSAQR